jgi:hypothetical protein
MTSNEAIRRLVRERMPYLCEYCHASEAASAGWGSLALQSVEALRILLSTRPIMPGGQEKRVCAHQHTTSQTYWMPMRPHASKPKTPVTGVTTPGYRRTGTRYYHRRGKFLAVAGQEGFIAPTPEEAWAWVDTTHPEDDGAIVQYVRPETGPRIYASHR